MKIQLKNKGFHLKTKSKLDKLILVILSRMLVFGVCPEAVFYYQKSKKEWKNAKTDSSIF